MFVAMWKSPAWMKPAVTRRHHSPAASPICSLPTNNDPLTNTGPPARVNDAPVARAQRKTATLIPISVFVTRAWVLAKAVFRRTRVVALRTPCGLPEWSGQRRPTGA
jgi:hypothetical protein